MLHRFATPILFGLLALIWGSSFLFIKLALEGMSPVQVVVGRLGFGALTLVIVMLVTRRRWPRAHALRGHGLDRQRPAERRPGKECE